jgi:hypothetical protein
MLASVDLVRESDELTVRVPDEDADFVAPEGVSVVEGVSVGLMSVAVGILLPVPTLIEGDTVTPCVKLLTEKESVNDSLEVPDSVHAMDEEKLGVNSDGVCVGDSVLECGFVSPDDDGDNVREIVRVGGDTDPVSVAVRRIELGESVGELEAVGETDREGVGDL